jgi:hypothetical protein
MICLLKFDFFCFVGVTMQLLIVVLGNNRTEFGLTIAAIPVVLILLAFAGVAVRHEIKWLMSVSLVLMLASETYFSACDMCGVCRAPADPLRRSLQARALLLVPILGGVHLHADDAHLLQHVSSSPMFTPLLTPARPAIIAFLILFATFAVGLRCFADFDKGLRGAKTAALPDASGRKPAPTPAYMGSASDRQSYFAGGAPLQHRMSIE